MAGRCAGVLRVVSRQGRFAQLRHPLSAYTSSSQWMSTATDSPTPSASPPPPPPPPTTSADPRINRLVDDIAGLTLLQAADLVTALKSKLNIQEIAMPAAAAAAPAAAVASDEPPPEKPKEKTIFNVKLESFNASSKPKIIKEVKSLVPNLTLIEAKKFVESLPRILKENLPKEDAEKLAKVFEGLGGVVKLE